jgi:hypothetical protein
LFAFGTDQRGRAVKLSLMFASMIIGAVPRMGKTFALRLIRGVKVGHMRSGRPRQSSAREPMPMMPSVALSSTPNIRSISVR